MRFEYKKKLIEKGEIHISELIKTLGNKVYLIMFITMIFAFISIFYALSLPNIYKSEVLVKPNSSKQLSGSSLGSLSSIANIAGINIGGSSSDITDEAISTIKSQEFLSKLIKKHSLVVPIMASKKWNANTDELEINNRIYDEIEGKWLVEFPTNKSPSNKEPSPQLVVKEFRKNLEITQDRNNGFLTISYKSHSPYFSKEVLNYLLEAINNFMREKEVERATKSLIFLDQQIKNTNVQEVKKALSDLVKQETQKIVLSEASDEYVFMVIDNAVAPDFKDSPSRAVICMLITFFGFVFANAFVIISRIRAEK